MDYIRPFSVKAILIIFIYILLFVFNSSIIAQNESQADTIKIKTDSSILYLTPMEYAFMMHEETSWLFKANTVFYAGRAYLKLGIEKRIARSFTLNLGIGQTSFSAQEGFAEKFVLQSYLESRWYYRQSKQVREKKVARNMSDNYLAFGIGYGHFFGDVDYDFWSIYAKWGLQRRFLKYGYADFGLKVGTELGFGRFIYTMSTYVDLGLALTKDKYKLDHEKLCPILRCYESNKFIVKSNLNGLFSLGLYGETKGINIFPQIAMERKIGKTEFSVNTELQLGFNYMEIRNINERNYIYRNWIGNFLFEGRWYYNLNQRIMKGKTGNGLSANYVALGGRYSYNYDSRYASGFFGSGIYVTTGWQRLFSKHLYFDLNVGVEYEFESKGYKERIDSRFNLAVGYRF